MSKTLRRTLPKVNNIAADLFDAGDTGKTKSMTATLRFANSSEKKLELAAKLIRGKRVNDAILLLENAPWKAAKILLKVVKSALANVKHNLGIENEDMLVISRVDIGRGPKYKRYRFASRARVHPYVKHRSFVRVVLDIK
jgi:large subunit ribosomal protein L22